jgi:hypothetical protein
VKALTARELANYASVHSEIEVTLERTDSAITLADKAIRLAKRRGAGNAAGALADQAYCMFVKAGLLEWRARRWGTPAKSAEGVDRFREVIEIWQKAGPPSDDVDDLARVHLKTMYLLRRTAGDTAHPNEQRHGDAILALKGDTADKESRSWLAWYQAIVHADRGNTEAAQRVAYRQSVIDEDEPADIRGRRHSLLRRLINDNADVQRNSAAIVKLTQLLYS